MLLAKVELLLVQRLGQGLSQEKEGQQGLP
jgi:hypothetical protein